MIIDDVFLPEEMAEISAEKWFYSLELRMRMKLQ